MRRNTYLSVIIPVYNEEESIPLLHERLKYVLKTQPFSYEVIYVDDGSTDHTCKQLQMTTLNDPQVRIVQLRRNFGQTAAIAAGVDASTGQILVFMDGDMQNDPVDIPRLLAKVEEGYDVVSGWRKNRQDAQISRKLPSWIANRLISKVTGLHLHDYGCTLKAFRWEVFQHMRLYGEMHRFLPAYAALAGASITEIPVHHHPRRFGVSKYGISRTIRVVLDLMTVKFLGKYGTRPSHAFGIPGLLLLATGFLLMMSSAGAKLNPLRAQSHGLLPAVVFGKSSHENIGSFASKTPVILLMLGFGLQCLMMGISAEMLTRIYYESQGKPVYTIKATYPLSAANSEKSEAA